jgi:hypothetical protein
MPFRKHVRCIWSNPRTVRLSVDGGARGSAGAEGRERV